MRWIAPTPPPRWLLGLWHERAGRAEQLPADGRLRRHAIGCGPRPRPHTRSSQGERIMRFRDLMTLRTPAQVADDARATEARVLAPLDALVIEAREVVEHYREALPSVFSSRRDRRAGDRREVAPHAAAMPPRLQPFDLTHKRGAGRGGAL